MSYLSCRSRNLSLAGFCHRTTCGTGELYGADNGFLRGYHLEAGEVEFAYLEGLAQTEVIDVDNQAFGNFGIGSLNLDFLHGEGQLTTGLDTFGVAFELDGNLHYDGLVSLDFEQVDMEDGILYWVELYLAENSVLLFAVDIQVDNEDVGGVDQLAYSIVGEDQVGSDDAATVLDFNELLAFLESAGVRQFYDFASVEDSGNLALGAEGLCGFLAKLNTGLGVQCISLHELKNLCYSKLNYLISHHTGEARKLLQGELLISSLKSEVRKSAAKLRNFSITAKRLPLFLI